jgi:hypothetical protein
MPQVQVLVSTQTGERDRPACVAEAAAARRRPGRRWQRPVANILPQKRSAGRRPPRAGRTRSPSSNARRAGWVGCNFALNRIPADARIPVVITVSSLPPSSAAVPAASLNLPIGRRDACATVIVPPEEVREKIRQQWIVGDEVTSLGLEPGTGQASSRRLLLENLIDLT